MSVDDLLPTILVARKFMFQNCIEQCAARVLQGVEDATSLCDAWTFVAGMWPRKPSPHLARYLALAFQSIPMQAIHEMP
jgi:hypothetical protein